MTGDGKNIRDFFYVKITYSNGKVVRYKQFPMETYENGVKEHYIKDVTPLNRFEVFLIDVVDWFRGLKR